MESFLFAPPHIHQTTATASEMDGGKYELLELGYYFRAQDNDGFYWEYLVEGRALLLHAS